MSVAARTQTTSADRHRHPPGPAEADLGGAAGAEHGQRVAGDAGDRHLRQRDHAAVAAEERERERDQAEHQRLRGDLEGEERRRDEREDEQAASTTTWRSDIARRSARGAAPPALGVGGARSRAGRRRRTVDAGSRRDRRRRAGTFMPSRQCGGAHAGRPMMPRGRNASTPTRIRKVKTTL